MTRDLHEKIGEVSTENLFASLNPEPIIKPAVIKKGAASATYQRGSLMAKGADGKLILLGSDVDATGTASATGDGSTVKFPVIVGGNPSSVLTEVKVGGTATTEYSYNPVTGEIVFDSAPANAAAIAIKYSVGGGNADCVLADDTVVGTSTDENVLVYVSGHFNASALTVAEDYTITEADKDLLRMKGILLGNSQNPV
jgi:hypothetical protein